MLSDCMDISKVGGKEISWEDNIIAELCRPEEALAQINDALQTLQQVQRSKSH